MNYNIPIFPLHLVAFPGEKLNLHIFEPRYKQLILDCKNQNLTFGIPPFQKGQKMNIGTKMEVLSIEKVHNDGSMDIKTKAISVFKIQSIIKNYNDKLYSGATVIDLNDIQDGDIKSMTTIVQYIKSLHSLFKLKKEIPVNINQVSTYIIGHVVGFSFEQELKMLGIENEKNRQTFMLNHLEAFLPQAKMYEEIKEKIKMNGHFRNVIPPNFL